MKYHIHYFDGKKLWHKTHFTKNLRGAKREAGLCTPEGFFDDHEAYIAIYEFDGMYPVSIKQRPNATTQRAFWEDNNQSTTKMGE